MPSDTYRGGGGGGGIIGHYFPFANFYIKQASYDSLVPAALYLNEGQRQVTAGVFFLPVVLLV